MRGWKPSSLTVMSPQRSPASTLNCSGSPWTRVTPPPSPREPSARDEPVLTGTRNALHIWLTRVRELQPVPGRIHPAVRLDTAGDLDRLIALGATRQWDDPRGRWTVLADPHGNLFCAVYPAP